MKSHFQEKGRREVHITFFIGGLSGGGAERVTCNLASFLADRGHQVVIMTMTDDEPSYALNRSIQRFPLLHIAERRGALYNSAIRLFRFIKFLLKSNTDCYVVMLPETTILLLQFRWLIKAKVIAAERATPSRYSAKRQKRLKALARNADGWVFQTNEAQKWYGKATANALTQIIPNAINPNFIIEPFKGERTKIIVTVGRLTEQKNHSLLINAFARICPLFPNYRLVIYGDGLLRDSLMSLSQTAGITDKVSFPGYSTNIEEDIMSASLFVLSSDYEGMPNALMEAMAMGLPCVSTDCEGGGARFLIQDAVNGLLVPQGDVDALAEAMTRMLSDKELADRCGSNAHLIIERLAPDIIYTRWEQLVHTLIQS